MAGSYKSILDPGTANRMGGLQQQVFLIPYADLLTIQKAVAGKITIAHVPVTNKGFVKLYITKDTGEISLDTQGGPDRQSFIVKGEFYHPGESDEIVNFANLCKNERWIMLAPLPGSNELIQVGNEEFQVNIKPSYSTTKNSGDGRGWKFEVEAFMADMIKYTAPTIPMLPTP